LRIWKTSAECLVLGLFRPEERKDYVGYFQNTGSDCLIEMHHRTFAGGTAQYIPEASFLS
jgi:hypothetical protein